MNEILHQIDRSRFESKRKKAIELGEQAELDMVRQRKEKGLPLYPKGLPSIRREIVHLEDQNKK